MFRTTQLLDLQKNLLKINTCPILARHLMNIVRQFCLGCSPSSIASSLNIDQTLINAVNDQIELTPRLLLYGMITKSIVSYQHNYLQNSKSKCREGVIWCRKTIPVLQNFALSLWKYRCDYLHKSSQSTMEQHTRTQAYQLFLNLASDPYKLPFDNRNLLSKPRSFFRTSNLRNLQFWLDRITLALEIQNNRVQAGVSDIRDWLRSARVPESKMYFPDDDFLYDSDDSRFDIIKFPDEEFPEHWKNNLANSRSLK